MNIRQIIIAATLAALAAATSAQDNASNAAETATDAIIHTSMGDIHLKLFRDRAPESVKNFVQYAEDGFYTDTIFHRVIPGFMIQGGGLTEDLERKATRDPITNEADNGIANTRGTVAMARTMQPHSATSQFFINHADNASLDHTGKQDPRSWGYAVFAEVTKGMDVVDKIAQVETTTVGRHRNVPKEPVVIESVEIVTAE